MSFRFDTFDMLQVILISVHTFITYNYIIDLKLLYKQQVIYRIKKLIKLALNCIQ